MFATEDWWSVWIGLAIFGTSLVSLAGVDLVGWMVRPRAWEWTNLAGDFAWSTLLGAAGAGYAAWQPLVAWLTTYVVFALLFTIGAYFQGVDVRRFVLGFSVLFAVTWVAWIAGN
jgi:hypothetical protein